LSAVHAIGLSSQVFLIFLLLVLPFAAIRGARRFNAPAPPDGAPRKRPIPSRMTMFANTSVMLTVLFALAWFTARTSGFHIFAVAQIGARELLAGLAALVVMVALMPVSRLMRSAEELRTAPVNRMMPQGPRETTIYSLMCVIAGVSEEAVYRGVLVQVLWYMLGSPWPAMLIAAVAFAVVHGIQGWKSALLVFVIACLMHALVWFTGTLVIAMLVHAIYDLAVPTLRRKISLGLPKDLGRSAG
jgi:membrane protease YdiL (CAAX protease family)